MKEFSVSQLNNFIKNVLDDEYVLSNIKVQAEIVEFSIVKGNAYFVLSDNINNISCIMFGGCQALEIGDTVSVVGTIRYYTRLGQIRFIINTISKIDIIGQKQLAYNELKQKLLMQGLLDNRLPIPKVIQKIGLVTSIEGAVIHDFMTVTRERNTCVDVLVYPVRVQGDYSPAEIAQAIHVFNTMSQRPDVIVVARGGGSSVDLEAFDDEITVMAVAHSTIPVVSAIGHENDYSLCDLCASLRAGTPSIAAQMIVPDLNSKRVAVVELLNLITELVDSEFFRMYNSLAYLLQSIVYYSSANIEKLKNQIITYLTRVGTLTQSLYENNLIDLQKLSTKLDLLSPTKLLLQGYAKLQSSDQNIDSVLQLKKDDSIKVFLKDGNIDAKVMSIQENK